MNAKKSNLEIKPHLSIPRKEPIVISRKLGVNTGSMDIYVDAYQDGQLLFSKKGDSLLPNFLRVLMGCMGRKAYTDVDGGLLVTFNAVAYADGDRGVMYANSLEWDTITNVTAGSPTTITTSGGSTWSTASYIQIMGVTGISPDINGIHQISGGSGTSKQIAVSTSGTFTGNGARCRRWFPSDGFEVPDNDTFQRPFIVLGRDNTANIVDQQVINNEWDDGSAAYEIDYGTTLVSIPALDYSGKIGEVAFSCTITNNSGGTVALDEIGLFVPVTFNGDYWSSFMARDVLPSTINLATGKNITFNYRLRTSMQADGGFTENMIKLLYSQFIQANQTIDDVFGSTFSGGNNSSTFSCISPSGFGKISPTLAGVEGQYIGIQIGTGNTAATFADHELDARIDHGDATGEMIYYSTTVDNFQIVGSVASFDLTAVFENRSGGTINVAEIGLHAFNGVGTSSALEDVAMLSRHVLSGGPVAVGDTNILKVVYTIELTVA